MDECRRGSTQRRRSHFPRACKSVEQEEEEDAEVVEDEGEEKEGEEEVGESPTNQNEVRRWKTWQRRAELIQTVVRRRGLDMQRQGKFLVSLTDAELKEVAL